MIANRSMIDRGVFYNDNRYDDNRYYGNDFGSGNGSNWKEQILRVVIGNVIGSRLDGDGFDGLSQFEPDYNRVPYNFGNSRGNYAAHPQQGQNYGIPYNDEYQPEYGYRNTSFGGSSIAVGLLNSLPIAELIERYTGGGFASELIGNFLAQGYDQGFLAGEAATNSGNGEEYYQDPYVIEEGVYDPYSVSMGENRQTLSEGYELGYQDALNGQTEYDPHTEGNVDLVSLLLNNVWAVYRRLGEFRAETPQ